MPQNDIDAAANLATTLALGRANAARLIPMPAPQPQPLVNVTSAPGLIDNDTLGRIHKIATGLNTPLPNWHVMILSEPQWKQWQGSDAKTNDTGSTFSLLGTGRTYVRQKAIVGKRDDQIQDMLAHEMGHLVSNSTDEDVANKTRAAYYKTRTWQPAAQSATRN